MSVKGTTARAALVLLLAGTAPLAWAATKESAVEKLNRGLARALAGRPSSEISTITRGAADAYGRGASPHELINLVTDLHKDGVAAPGILNAIEAVGGLAEEGYTDAETRRGVALTVLQNLRDGVRGRELAEAIHDENRERKESAADGGHGGSSNAGGRGRSAEAKDKSEIRDELRRNPPSNMGGNGRGPAGARERGNSKDKGDKGNDKDKGKPDDAGPKK